VQDENAFDIFSAYGCVYEKHGLGIEAAFFPKMAEYRDDDTRAYVPGKG
jgi:hypothetical protein